MGWSVDFTIVNSILYNIIISRDVENVPGFKQSFAYFKIFLLIFQLHHKYCGHFKIARKASLKFDSGEVCGSGHCMLHKVNLAKVMEKDNIIVESLILGLLMS